VPTVKKVGPILRTARQGAGVSQSALARRVGISGSQLAQIENGQRVDPHFSTVARIAGAMGLSLDAIAASCGISGFGRTQRDGIPRRAGDLKLADDVGKVRRDLGRASARLDEIAKTFEDRRD
jgi:transcriptional regulator with XRE-family HTH domain